MKFKPTQCISARINIIKRKVDGIYRNHLSVLDITESQSSILLVLNEYKTLSQGQLAKILCLERSSLSRNLTRLKERGYIKGTPDYHPTIALTAKGEKFMGVLLPVWDRAMLEIDGIIGNEGWMQFEGFEKALA